jgi:peptide/nickel transport system permease protein
MEESPLARFSADFRASKLAVLGALLLFVILFIALFAPLISPQNPYDLAQLDVLDARLEPGATMGNGHTALLGTDDQGRDMLSGIFYGLRISLMVGTVATILALLIGATVGMLAAYVGGRLDGVLMRIADIQLSFPPILIALVLLALLGQGTG